MDSYNTSREVEKPKPALPVVLDPDVTIALKAIGQEVMRARAKFAPFNSAHEGYAVVLEELDELWDEVKLRKSLRDQERMRREAVQVAAMVVRFLTDLCG